MTLRSSTSPVARQSHIQNKADIFSLLTANQPRIRAFGVKRIGLFGSFVRSQQDSESDVDLLVEFEPGKKTFDNFLALASYLEDQLGRPVELITIESLSPYIGPHILSEVEYASLIG